MVPYYSKASYGALASPSGRSGPARRKGGPPSGMPRLIKSTKHAVIDQIYSNNAVLDYTYNLN